MAKGNPNDEFIRVRVTKELKESFLAYCAENDLSEASVGRLGIYELIAPAHKKRTGTKLSKPEVQPNNWAKEKSA